MKTIRRAQQRGHAHYGWLDTRHTFSFGRYHDPAQMGFGPLRVINEDVVQPGGGFGEHGHDNMEILSYVLKGRMEHRDSLGHTLELLPGEFQQMTAGRGIRHSERNPSTTEPVHFYQIWILPEAEGLPPSYQQKGFDDSGARNRWQLIAGPTAAGAPLTIRQQATLFRAIIESGEKLTSTLPVDRRGWLQVLRGEVSVDDERLVAGDGLAVTAEEAVTLTGIQSAEVLWFDLP